ncbi:hypothetical protein EXIGLDRAFT_717741, partial [Exidia glandulosa HHB12029]
ESVHCAQSACPRVAVKAPVVEHCNVVLDWIGRTPIVHQITSRRQTRVILLTRKGA